MSSDALQAEPAHRAAPACCHVAGEGPTACCGRAGSSWGEKAQALGFLSSVALQAAPSQSDGPS